MMTPLILLSTSHFQALLACVQLLQIAVDPGLAKATYPSTYIISPQTRRGNACCITTLTEMRVTSTWQTRMHILVLAILSQMVAEKSEGPVGDGQAVTESRNDRVSGKV